MLCRSCGRMNHAGQNSYDQKSAGPAVQRTATMRPFVEPAVRSFPMMAYTVPPVATRSGPTPSSAQTVARRSWRELSVAPVIRSTVMMRDSVRSVGAR